MSDASRSGVQPTGMKEILSPASVMFALKANSKKQLLQLLADKASQLTGLSERDIFETLLQRERLGSTGVGNGIAIPHGKLEKLDGITGVFAQLAKPVDFDALDDQPVDLVFLLLAPESAGADHLKALSKIARLLRDADLAERLRTSNDPSALYALMTQAAPPHAA